MFWSQSLSILDELILILMESNLGCRGAESCQGNSTLVFVLFLLLAWEISRTNSNSKPLSLYTVPLRTLVPFAVIFEVLGHTNPQLLVGLSSKCGRS